MKAVQFDRFGGPEVLEVRDVERPHAGPGEVMVAVRAASINPGEIAVREGLLEARWPTTLPCGEGSDLAGVVEEVGEGSAEFGVGDEVCGWVDTRSSHAEFALAPTTQLVAKPANVSWEAAGSLHVAPFAAYAGVKSVALERGDVVGVSAAAGGVGSVAVQLAVRAGAKVLGLASERNHDWLRAMGAIPVTYGDGQAERLREAAGGPIDAFIDNFGSGYADLAIELGVAPHRINTIAEYAAVQRLGVRGDGTAAVSNKATLQELADLLGAGELEIAVERTYPLAEVREAYVELAKRTTRGKIVLLIG